MGGHWKKKTAMLGLLFGFGLSSLVGFALYYTPGLPPPSRALVELSQEHPGINSSLTIPVTVWTGGQTGPTTTNLFHLLRENPDMGAGSLTPPTNSSTPGANGYGVLGGWGIVVIYIHQDSANSLPGHYIYVVLRDWGQSHEYPVHASVSDHELTVYQIIND